MNELVALALALIAAFVIVKYVKSVYRQQNRQDRLYNVSCECGFKGQVKRLPARCPKCQQFIGIKKAG
ncbi:MAG: hypothetical protein BWY87_01315 [Deltaproteobacteria bacterium ADurb.Bin510]|nr:MAG: hypothetical protein BWY87_01315 [Deltaproteobacteria bacterium ADurb.Bin510]